MPAYTAPRLLSPPYLNPVKDDRSLPGVAAAMPGYPDHSQNWAAQQNLSAVQYNARPSWDLAMSFSEPSGVAPVQVHEQQASPSVRGLVDLDTVQRDNQPAH